MVVDDPLDPLPLHSVDTSLGEVSHHAKGLRREVEVCHGTGFATVFNFDNDSHPID